MPGAHAVWQKRLAPVLGPAGWIYARLMRCRAGMYRNGRLPAWRPPAYCISVGNISWGGAGKTPLCEWILKWSLERGRVPALLSRGYGADPPRLPYTVRPDSPVRQAGDEPLMLARSCPRAAVVVDPRRARGGRLAGRMFSPGLFVLDDGFQHLGVQRDLDLVLLKPQDLRGDWNVVLPAGAWREGSFALQRASAFLLNAEPSCFENLRGLVRRRLGALGKPVFSFQVRPVRLKRVVDGTERELAQDGPYLLVSGVGRPQGLERSVSDAMGARPAAHLAFPDHHFYSPRDWRQIRSEAARLGCRMVLCTPKDEVKLAGYADSTVWSIDSQLRFGPGEYGQIPFEEWFEQALSG
jgi:tetraacyldisaccharide 4'-kinase